MTPEKATIAVAARTVLRDLSTGDIGRAATIDSDGETVIVRLVNGDKRVWSDTLDLVADDTLEACGRCNQVVAKETIEVTGPYRCCRSCTHVVRS